jgi:hypothetical protein
MYSLTDSAIAHAKSAQKLLEPDGSFLNTQKAAVPVFVNLLFQSIEISLKSFATDTGILSPKELRSPNLQNGHGVREIAEAINKKMPPKEVISLLLPMKGFAISNAIIVKMVYGSEFEPTRLSYARRKITYAEFIKGDLQVVNGAKDWVNAVLAASQNIGSAVLEFKND